MDVTIENAGGVAVVKPAGRLDFGAADPFLKQLESTIGAATRPTGVIVDASALEYVSSAGLRVFLVAARSAKAAGVGIAVCSLRKEVLDVFEVSGFTRVIDVLPDLAAARARISSAS